MLISRRQTFAFLTCASLAFVAQSSIRERRNNNNNNNMAAIATIRAANAAFAKSQSAKGLVAVFVGATSGIGEAAMRAFVSSTVDSTVYFIGRSETAGAKITTELKALNPSSKVQFMQADTTLLATVDSLTKRIAAQESKLNLLFMSPGYITMAGRDESPEGIDRKMSVSYYSRLRFALNLLPLLTTTERSRIISVLGTGRESLLNTADLSLSAPGNFSFLAVEAHTVTMTSLAFEELSLRYPSIGWLHVNPGVVNTGLLRGLPAPLRVLGKAVAGCFCVPVEDCGNGMLYLGTEEKYGRGLWLVDWEGVNMDSRVGGGKWWGRGGNWGGEEQRGAVWKHLEQVMEGVPRV